jgi:DNA polymerase I-like protein with 3'-5' exonuclease and polymerase domains
MEQARVMPRDHHVEGQLQLLVPTSDWAPPTDLPTLRQQTIALDTETRDIGLEKGKGPGWAYKEGYICGVSVAWRGGSIYVPVRHPDTECWPFDTVLRWVDDLLTHNRVCFFNGGYDLGWLRAEGCAAWPERLEDGQVGAVMLDENYDTYSLDDCCARAGIPGKDEQLLREAAVAFGVKPIAGSVKHGLWRLPARYVGPYAEQDAVATLRLCASQHNQLRHEGVAGAYGTEIKLMRVVHAMRTRGIRVDLGAVEQAIDRVRGLVEKELLKVEVPSAWQRRATADDLRSPLRLAEMFDAEGVRYARTPKSRLPSFTKDWLSKCPHPLARQVRRVRQLQDLADKFLGTYIRDFAHRGRIHAEIHQLRDEEGGARTLRLSYSNPPLQQMPSRDPDLAPLVRGAFLPEEGTDWLAADYMGQEPRITTHFASLCAPDAARHGISILGAARFVALYCDDPNPDLHQFTADILKRPRSAAKELNLALTYRAGYKKLATVMNISEDNAKDLWNEFHAKIPHIKGLSQYAQKMAEDHGYITLIDGARRHYPLWEPVWRTEDFSVKALHLKEARKRWPHERLRRAFAYQAANSLIQGSAARQMKLALVATYEAGYLPLVSMHDEADFCVTSARECEEIGAIMADVVKLVVPVTCDLEVGSTWGLAKTDYREYYLNGT